MRAEESFNSLQFFNQSDSQLLIFSAVSFQSFRPRIYSLQSFKVSDKICSSSLRSSIYMFCFSYLATCSSIFKSNALLSSLSMENCGFYQRIDLFSNITCRYSSSSSSFCLIILPMLLISRMIRFRSSASMISGRQVLTSYSVMMSPLEMALTFYRQNSKVMSCAWFFWSCVRVIQVMVLMALLSLGLISDSLARLYRSSKLEEARL